jgi:hypothetical protein
MESCAPMTGLYWFPVRSNSIQNLSCSAALALRIPIYCPKIGAQETKESGNEQSIYNKLITGYQIGILQEAKSV